MQMRLKATTNCNWSVSSFAALRSLPFLYTPERPSQNEHRESKLDENKVINLFYRSLINTFIFHFTISIPERCLCVCGVKKLKQKILITCLVEIDWLLTLHAATIIWSILNDAMWRDIYFKWTRKQENFQTWLVLPIERLNGNTTKSLVRILHILSHFLFSYLEL